MVHLPRVMLAAPASGSGKTTVTCGLLQVLKNRGLDPASFKCGPDYIDPMFHSRVIGAKSRNLDTFFAEKEVIRYLFAKTALGSGISVLEGVMGIYDGLGGTSLRASSYDLAQVTDTPIILVVNARGMSRSVIPMICGYLDYQKQFGKRMIRGVILNQTTRMTYLMLKDQIEQETGIRLYGYVPRLTDCVIESRHLGLVTPDEILDLRQKLERLSEELEECLDMEGILNLAETAEDYRDEELTMPESAAVFCRDTRDTNEKVGRTAESGTALRPRIAVAMDEAFCFYYQDNLDLMEEMGAELVPFSPVHDAALPEAISGILLGGGYPELYAEALAANQTMRDQIRRRIENGIPYLAECGGFMYLHESMEDMEGRSWPMCGCIGGKSFRTPKLSRFGYISLSSEPGEEQLLPQGQTIRGHEFHYFDSTSAGCSYLAAKPAGRRQWQCIHGTKNSAAGYPHLYYWSDPEFIYRFIRQCAGYSGT
ncbi:MAG: cobyrinate a,c-diamide synthase [Lachnospiraceae bacterium]|nr:cobyrinate a,c-diamide synthase [Lachnospiraceae bacterium]